MLIIRQQTHEWLFGNLLRFQDFTELQKNQIFFLAIKNLAYSIIDLVEKEKFNLLLNVFLNNINNLSLTIN